MLRVAVDAGDLGGHRLQADVTGFGRPRTVADRLADLGQQRAAQAARGRSARRARPVRVRAGTA